MANKSIDGDERLGSKTYDAGRINRSAEHSEVREPRELSDIERKKERFSMLRDAQTLLPSVPKIPGYHLCWLTTTNNKDTLESRYRRGYTLVKPEELSGFHFSSQKDGESTSDRIMINEMVLGKIPEELFYEAMEYLHHDLPNESINNLKNSVQIGADSRGRSVAYTGGDFNKGVADGYSMLKTAQKASFAGIN